MNCFHGSDLCQMTDSLLLNTTNVNMAAAGISRSPSVGTVSRPMTRTQGILLETMQYVEPRKNVAVPNHLLESSKVKYLTCISLLVCEHVFHVFHVCVNIEHMSVTVSVYHD